jgi:hypothetical protein
MEGTCKCEIHKNEKKNKIGPDYIGRFARKKKTAPSTRHKRVTPEGK